MPKKRKIAINVEVFEDEETGKLNVVCDVEENNSSMSVVSLAVYNLEKIKLDLIDRDYEGEGYTIMDTGDDEYDEGEF